MGKKITLRMPIDLGNGNATNWLCRTDQAGEGVTRHVRRKGRPDGWVDTVLASFMTATEVRAHFEQLGYDVTFVDLSDRKA